MTAKWYITRRAMTDGHATQNSIKKASVGPLPTTMLLELASTGEVGADDLVQMDGTDVLISLAQFLGFALGGKLPDFEASAALASSSSQPISSRDTAVPDWLADVVKVETKPPRPPVVPDWLEDMCRSEQLLLDSRANKTTLAEVALDWMDDIRQIEESLRLRPAPRTEAPPSTKALPESTPALTQHARPTAPTPARAAPQQPAPEPPKQHGFDPETGRILDPVAYALFQKAEAQRRRDEQHKQPTVSVAEVFLDAQRALQVWVDDPANRALVAIGDMEPIRQCASVKELLARYDGYGSVMQEKLRKRLAFFVENRRKFVKAFC